MSASVASFTSMTTMVVSLGPGPISYSARILLTVIFVIGMWSTSPDSKLANLELCLQKTLFTSRSSQANPGFMLHRSVIAYYLL